MRRNDPIPAKTTAKRSAVETQDDDVPGTTTISTDSDVFLLTSSGFPGIGRSSFRRYNKATEKAIKSVENASNGERYAAREEYAEESAKKMASFYVGTRGGGGKKSSSQKEKATKKKRKSVTKSV